jgi:CYTH domain-containing protein
MQSSDQVVWKLGQKVREEETSPEMVKLTNIYLSEQEFSVFAELDASTLSKTRWRWDFDDHTLAVDAFHGELAGLILAEVELRLGDDRLGAPPGALADVTDDDHYSGGALAALDGQAARMLVLAISPDVDGRSSK